MSASLVIVAVYDRQSAAYMTPMFFATTGQAIRSFADEVNRKDESLITRHPEDFSMHELGSFDPSDGRFVLLDQAKLLSNAFNLKI